MISKDKLRNSFSRIKVDIDYLRNVIYEIKNEINNFRQDQYNIYSHMTQKDTELAYEIKLLKEKINNLEKQLEFERSLKH